VIFSFRWAAVRWLAFAMALAVAMAAQAHGVRIGSLQLDHPYAVPSEPGEPHGKAYLRSIKNMGSQADRLLSASTPMAAQVKLHRLKPDAHGRRGIQMDAIDLPAKSTTLLRHSGDYQLSLIDLKRPLKDGDRFDLTLNFAHAGSQTVQVWVQTPRDLTSGKHDH